MSRGYGCCTLGQGHAGHRNQGRLQMEAPSSGCQRLPGNATRTLRGHALRAVSNVPHFAEGPSLPMIEPLY